GVEHLEIRDSEAGEVLPENLVPIFGLLFGVAPGIEITIIFGEIAEALLGYCAFKGTVGLELKSRGSADGVEVGRKNRKLDHLAFRAFHQHSVAGLKIVFQLAEGCFFPSRVKDEVLASGLCRDKAAEFRRTVAFGNFDGGDHMIADDRRRLGIYD